MNITINNIEVEEIFNKINIFISSISKIDNNLNNINTKINNINKIINKFNNNSNLKDTYSYLNFQINLLNNEKLYYHNIKKIIITKFKKDIINIAENILIILDSLDNINVNDNNTKKIILDKITNINIDKKNDNINIKKILNNTINNFLLISDFILLFDNYINNEDLNNKSNNYHCNNYT